MLISLSEAGVLDYEVIKLHVYEHVDALTCRSTACSSSSQNQRHTVVIAHYL